MDKQTNRQTDGHTSGHFDFQKASAQRADDLKKQKWIQTDINGREQKETDKSRKKLTESDIS